MDELFENVDPPLQSLSDILDALMRQVVERLGLATAELYLQDGGALVVKRTGRAISSEWTADIGPVGHRQTHAGSVDEAVHAADWRRPPRGAPPVRPPGADAGSASVDLPLSYAGQPVGELRVAWRKTSERKRAGLGRLQWFAQQCATLVKRYEVQTWAARRLGGPLLLVGLSRALRDAEATLERAAGSDLPVLLVGEFGTEKPQFAATIHVGGRRRDAPFIQVNCAEPAGLPAAWFEQAQGGTLFFNGVDDLAPRLQNELPLHMRSSLGQWLPALDAPDVRIIAATTADLRSRVCEGGFSQALLAELDILRVRAPPLRERVGDIGPLVAAALERRGFQAEEKRSDDLIAAFEAYAWPENLSELERVIARLAVMTDDRPILQDDIVRHAPWITASDQALPTAEAPPARRTPALTPEGPDRWVQCALTQDEAELGTLHGALRRALLFLGQHYAEPISLEQLARHAHVSPSHLSFLFRSGLDMPFKTLLGRIRVHRAKEVLAADQNRQITEVAMSVGFADLSHFEKSFRRIVGQSPREYRRAAGERSRPGAVGSPPS